MAPPQASAKNEIPSIAVESRKSRPEGSGALFTLLVGEEAPDYASFLALVKETGRHLNTFVPPEGFSPEPPVPEMSLSAESAKALGAGSLRDFYSLALDGEEARAVKNREGRLPAYFPQGPESVRPALNFIEAKCANLAKAIAELKKNWPEGEDGLEAAVRPLENTLEALEENRSGLTRVERDLWPRMKQESLEWPKDAKNLWHKAQGLRQSVNPLLKASKAGAADGEGQGLLDRGRRSLTKAVMELKNLVGRARETVEAEAAWHRAYESFLTDLDDYMAVAVDGSQSGRDWNSDHRWLSGCLANLEKDDRRLRDEAAQGAESLRKALGVLVETEGRLSGHQGGEMLEGLETVGRGVQALWRSTIERRRHMARIYFTIPSRLGRPQFLEKSMMATAQALGRTQALLEDLRHQLSLAGGKLSTTHRLRGEGKGLAERLGHSKSRAPKLKIARKRLSVLSAVVEQRQSLTAARDQLENAVARGEETEKQLSRGRLENSRMYRELKAAALERERLTDQLSSARQKLGEAGLVKARLLKVFAHKSSIWDDIERSRQKLLSDNEALKAEKADLKIKRSKLAALYSRERRELKRLNAELKESQSELGRTKEFVEQRHDLEKRLDETRREKEALAVRSREVEIQLQERSTQLAAAVAQADSLSIELARHREELAAASRARLSLSERAAALRRRQDVLVQAHTSLQKALQRKSGQLTRSETEKEALDLKLNRQKKNILRLVATRQQLRAELGAARLTIFDLEKERDHIFHQLKNAQSAIARSQQEKSDLNTLARGLSEEKTFLIGQLEAVGQEKDSLIENLKNLEQELAEEKDLNLERLASAAREKEELVLRLESLGQELVAEKTVEADRLDAVAREKDDLSRRIRELEEENGRLLSVEEEKNALSIRLSALEEEKERLASLAAELERRNAELSGQLNELEAKVSEELFPFIRIMGEALWRSEAQLKRARSASTRLLERFQLEFEVREANLRLQAAGRELELTTGARGEKEELIKRLEQLESERQILESEHQSLAGEHQSLTNEHQALKSGHQALADEHQALKSEHQSLSGEHQALRSEHQSLAGEHQVLKSEHHSLAGEHQALKSDHQALADEYQVLQNDHQSLAGEHQALVGDYQSLAGEHQSLKSDHQSLADEHQSLLGEHRSLAETHRSIVGERQALIDEQRALAGDRQSLEAERDRLAGRNFRLRRAMGVMKNRYSSRLEDNLAKQGDLKNLLESQEQELKLQKDKLAKLEPLVTYFIASAEAGGPSSAFRLDAELMAYLKEAGKVLGHEMAFDGESGDDSDEAAQALFEVADPADLPIVARLRARLNEVRPLVAFLAGSFISTVAELAQARQERSALSEELEKIKQERETLAGGSGRIPSEAASAPQGGAQLQDELERVRRENGVLAGRLDLAASTRSALESSLSERENELTAAREQASALSEEKGRLTEHLEEKKKEISLLKSELAQADRDLAENDGRLEAAWAAMNYLGTRASDTLGNLKSKYEAQARQIDGLSLELKRRELIIGNLEERQNKLALLYWTLVARAATAEPGQLAAQNLTPPLELAPAGGPTLLEASSGFEILMPDFDGPAAADNADHSGGYGLGRGLMEGVKKVARRSLFTLILAGSLVMPGIAGAEEARTAVPRGEVIVASAPEIDPQIHSRLESVYIGRTVSLEKVAVDLRLAGRPAMENRLEEMVSELAAGHGLSNNEFLRLVRTARGPEDTVHLDEFRGRQGSLALLACHLPKLSRQMALWSGATLTSARLSSLMQSASDFKPSEGGYWERMYFDLTAAGHSIDEALAFVMEALDQKKTPYEGRRPEFAGRLAPFPQLENLGPERFIAFMSDYISDSWPKLSRRGRQQAARRLAGDLYFSARLFKLPVTLLSTVAHEEAETDQVDFFRRGSTCAIHARAADLSDLTRSFSQVWQDGQPPLCDLDEALAASEKETFVEGVYRRKMALVMAYNKSLSSGSSLFDEI